MTDGITLTIYQQGIPVQERDADEVLIKHRFSTCGEITIRTLPDTESIEAYKIGSIIITEPIRDIFIIEKLELTEDSLTATGRTAESILARRVYEKTEAFTGQARTIIGGLMSGFTGVRALPIALTADETLTQNIDFQKTGATILDVLQAVCEQTDSGYSLDYNADTEQFSINVKKSDENNNVLFSPEYDNVTACILQGSIENYATTAYIAGEGEGVDRVVVSAGDTTKAGLDRFEIYVDQRNERKQDGVTDTVYRAQLQAKGMEELATHGFSSAMSGDIIQTDQCIYGIDYTLGDIVLVENGQWGVADAYHVVEVEESQTASGYVVTPIFAKKGE